MSTPTGPWDRIRDYVEGLGSLVGGPLGALGMASRAQRGVITKDDLEPSRRDERGFWENYSGRMRSIADHAPGIEAPNTPPPPDFSHGRDPNSIAAAIDRQRQERDRMAAQQNSLAAASKGNTTTTTTAPPEGPHIRYALPVPGGGMGPMTDYDPNVGAPFQGENEVGDLSADASIAERGHPGGGAFSPSPTPVIGKDAMGAPTFDWSGVANPDAFEAYTDPIRHALQKAEQTRAEEMAKDPMWEFRQKAKIWGDTQVGIQTGIREAMLIAEEEATKAIVARVRKEMPGATPEQMKAEIQKRLDEWRYSQQNMRMPSSYGMPNSVF